MSRKLDRLTKDVISNIGFLEEYIDDTEVLAIAIKEKIESIDDETIKDELSETFHKMWNELIVENIATYKKFFNNFSLIEKNVDWQIDKKTSEFKQSIPNPPSPLRTHKQALKITKDN